MPEINPPLLKVGQTGHLNGQNFHIAGRIEMAMDDGGVTYGWNEYYLVAPDGNAATLVQEDGEHGVEWRIFRLIEPSRPITAAEAATKKVGETIDLTGERLRISLVDESRVVRIEGQAPEGVEEGDVARYFNAESGNQMVVVSWTGDEVEVFRGIQLPGHAVNRAFGLKPQPIQLRPAVSTKPPGSGTTRKVLVTIVLALLGIGFVNGRRLGCNKTSVSTAAPMPIAPKLALGHTGMVHGAAHRVASRTQVEIARVGTRHTRQEYQLADETGASVFLVQGTSRSADEWLWLQPLEVTTESPLRPSQAATNRVGDAVFIGGETLRVTDLFLTRIRGTEGTNPARAGMEWYGLEARGPNLRIVARWDERDLTTYRVAPASKAELDAFGVR